MSKKKVIITGGTGLLGSTAALRMREQWRIDLSVRNHEVHIPGVQSHQTRLENLDEVRNLLYKVKPDCLVHAAGMTNIEECENQNYRAYISNVITSSTLARACSELGVRYIYISSDHVARDKELSTEEEVGFPVNIYAKTKLEGEFEVLRNCPSALVLRTNFFTWGTSYRKSFLDFIVDNLKSHKEITLFDDVRFNPLSAELLCHYLDSLINVSAEGIFNLSLDEVLSKYEFGLLVARIFDLDSRFIIRGKLADNKSLTRRPFNLSLDNSLLKKKIGISLTPNYEDILKSLKDNELAYKEDLNISFSEKSGTRNINYGRQSINDTDFESVLTALDSPWLTQGPGVENFERMVAAFTGSKYAVAMSNWTCGLHMAVLAAGVGPDDFVITSPISFVASSNCAIYAGATPLFVDIDPKTLNMDPAKLEELLEKYSPRVKAIIPVHFAGAPCDMEKIAALALKYNVAIIEDAAHAIGGRYLSGERIGNNRYSQMVGFSFHPVKNMTTGEGGLITTDDEKIYRKLLRLRSHGITKGNDQFLNSDEAYTNGVPNPWYYEMQELGFNYRITDLQCALGASQLHQLDKFVASKMNIVKMYDQEFQDLKNLQLPQKSSRSFSGNHLYVVTINFSALGVTRAALFSKFREGGVNLHLHYIPIYRQPFYKECFPTNFENFPYSEAYYSQAVTLPVYPGMTISDAKRIIQLVKDHIG